MPARKSIRPRRRRNIRRRKAGGNRRRGARSGVPDIAYLSERHSYVSKYPDGNFRSNEMYNIMDTRLDMFPRAVQVAQAYQHFKIKQVKLTLKFSYDTFQQGAGNGSRPNLYYMIDKAGALPTNSTLELLKSTGAKPHTIDNRQFTITWRPSVLNEVLNSGLGNPVGTQYKMTPWLSTTSGPIQPGVFIPSAVAHLGLYWYVEQLFGGGTQFNAELEVQFAFKKPLWKIQSGAPQAQSGMIATTDASSDGIVGGPDSNLAPV